MMNNSMVLQEKLNLMVETECITSTQKKELCGIVLEFHQKYNRTHSEKSADHVTFEALKKIVVLTWGIVNRLTKKGIKLVVIEKIILDNSKSIKELKNLFNYDEYSAIYTYLIRPSINFGLNIYRSSEQNGPIQHLDIFINRVIDLLKVYIQFRTMMFSNYYEIGYVKSSHVKIYHQISQQIKNLHMKEEAFEGIYEDTFSRRRLNLI